MEKKSINQLTNWRALDVIAHPIMEQISEYTNDCAEIALVCEK